jgi:hypothetical protein
MPCKKNRRKTPEGTITDLIAEHQLQVLERDLELIEKNGDFIPWGQAKKELGL